jgi:hypothetical protein
MKNWGGKKILTLNKLICNNFIECATYNATENIKSYKTGKETKVSRYS